MSEAIKAQEEEQEIEVRSDIEAKWQIERRNKIIADRDELISFYEDQIRAVKEDADFKIGFIDRSLYAFFMSKPHQKTKTQEYVKLSCGKLVLKTQNPEYKRDDKTVIAWLKENQGGKFVKVKEELDWAGLKAATGVIDGRIATGDGEFVPGVEVVEREPKFTVE